MSSIREDIINNCKYYKGQHQSPYKQSSNEDVFWECERQYVNNAVHSEAFRQEWASEAEYYIHTHPNEKNALTSKETSVETKGIILYIESMLTKWMPYDVDMIFEY